MSIAFANGAAPQGGGPAGGFLGFVPLILMFVIFYFLLIRPQQKRAKEHQDMISALKTGDKVITSGGIHGVISKVEETDVILEIAEKTKIKVTKVNVAVKL
jgi:preprotein translocase subunit YajC